MQDYGLVSIIMPTWACAGFISESIKSVIAQSYQNWELLIQDDCSTDGTDKVVQPFLEMDSRIKYECNPKNSGAAITRNNALRRAKGRWIAFLDADDLWLPEKLEKQLKFMVKNGYHFSYTGRDFINEASDPLGKYVTGPKHITKIGMYCFCWVGCLSVMYDAEKIGLIQIADIKKNNDYAIWLKAIKKADCYLLNENLACYRVRKGSISNNSYWKLIKWHYKLFHDADGKNALVSALLTLNNLIWGVWKKVYYTKIIEI